MSGQSRYLRSDVKSDEIAEKSDAKDLGRRESGQAESATVGHVGAIDRVDTRQQQRQRKDTETETIRLEVSCISEFELIILKSSDKKNSDFSVYLKNEHFCKLITL